jgi:hypothetical protein
MRPVERLMLAALLSCAFASGAAGQSPEEDRARKQARAVRVGDGEIRVDGRLDEVVWRTAPPLTGFVQREPDEGAPPTDTIDVRVAYDLDALYVGARMDSQAPIEAPMGRRDDAGLAERLLISLDTYLDRRTASTFGVTAAGVRLDSYFASDDEDADDEGFDPVWQAHVTRDERGWSAELWIPFSQLRFTDQEQQVWGLNVQRIIPARNEEVYWALLPRTDRRWASLFGDLHGIAGIRARRRIELLPYLAGGSRTRADRDPANPFTSGMDNDGRLGLDAKVGLGSNLTFEATVNPDFGQVEADPAEVNLTAFETFFDERRPFFLEGSQMLSAFVNNYFYSRRIGAAPPGEAPGDFVDQPSTTTILGAAKLTGRLRSGTSLGFLAAVTGEESARTFAVASNTLGRVRVAPRATYGVARVQQDFGPPGSTIGVMTSLLHRDLDPGDPLAAELTRNAASLSSDALLRLNDGEYEARLFAGGSYVSGEAAAIDRLQRSSARYVHRPDASHLDYDPTRTSLFGVKAGGSIERRTGDHWNWAADTQIETAGFETNDVGRTSSVDQLQSTWRLEYRETVPARWWRNYSLALSQEQMWSLAWDREVSAVGASGFLRWANFWETEAEVTYTFRAYDPRLTRGGPLMQTPHGWRAALEFENPSASRTRLEGSLLYGRDEDGGVTFQTGSRVEFQPGSQWAVSLEPRYERQVNTQQYVTTLDGGPGETFGRRYVFGSIDRSTYSTEVRFNYTFKPDLTLDFYGEPFAASGHYSALGDLAAARTRDIRVFGTRGTEAVRLADGALQVIDGETAFELRNRDFNVRSFRSNLVLRWEWRPGSLLYVVWQQDRSRDVIGGTRASLGDMFGSLGTRGTHVFALKASLWLSPG